jgi:hypothetical protein
VTRVILVRSADGDRKVPESQLASELELHDALSAHPDLLPAEDLGLVEPVVIGRESSLNGGFADLLLLDRAGRLALVEVKKQGNPDMRHVLAQLLGYAAGLWGLTTEELMDIVVRPHLGRDGSEAMPASFEEFVVTRFEQARPTALRDETDAIVATVAAALAAGEFTLVVAAPQIPQGLERSFDFLNARGMRLYGIEVGYFDNGSDRCFVPRLAVKPPSVKLADGHAKPIDRDTLLNALPEALGIVVARGLDALEEAGARVDWNSFGASIKTRRPPTREIAGITRRSIYILLKPPRTLAEPPFVALARQLDQARAGQPDSNGDYWRITYDQVSRDAVEAVIAAIADLISELEP